MRSKARNLSPRLWLLLKIRAAGWPPPAEFTRKYGGIVSMLMLFPLLMQAQMQLRNVTLTKDEKDERKENESGHRRDMLDLICDQIIHKLRNNKEKEKENGEMKMKKEEEETKKTTKEESEERRKTNEKNKITHDKIMQAFKTQLLEFMDHYNPDIEKRRNKTSKGKMKADKEEKNDNNAEDKGKTKEKHGKEKGKSEESQEKGKGERNEKQGGGKEDEKKKQWKGKEKTKKGKGKKEGRKERKKGKAEEKKGLEMKHIMGGVRKMMCWDKGHHDVTMGLMLAAELAEQELKEAAEKTKAGIETKFKDGSKLVKVRKQVDGLIEILNKQSASLVGRILNYPASAIGGASQTYPSSEDVRALTLTLKMLKRKNGGWDIADRVTHERKATRLRKVVSFIRRGCGTKETTMMCCTWALTIIQGSLTTMRSVYLSELIKQASETTAGVSRPRAIWETIQAMLYAEILLSLLSILSSRVRDLGLKRILRNLDLMLYSKMLQQDAEYFDVQENSWAVLQLIFGAKHDIRALLSFPSQVLKTISILLSSSLTLHAMHPRLVFVILPLWAFPMYIRRRCNSWARTVNRSIWSFSSLAFGNRWRAGECLQANLFPTMRANSREPAELREYECNSGRNARTDAKRQLVSQIMRTPGNLMTSFGKVGMYYFGGLQVSDKSMSTEQLTTFVHLGMSMTYSIENLMWNWNRVTDATSHRGSHLDRVMQLYEVMELKPEIGLYEGIKRPNDEYKGAIEFQNVTFAYPTKLSVNVLNGLSLNVQAGTTVGICGPAGCGKTTILRLILRLYDPKEGTIFLDGRPLKELQPLWVRTFIGLVEQEPKLINESIRKNLEYGVTEEFLELSDEEKDIRINKVLKDANIYETLMDTDKFPEHLRTRVGIGGCQLSGGEKQRIAIARALLRNPRLLLMDEPTSALDAESEHLVQEALDRLMKGRTTIVIAHRLKTLRDCDIILFCEDGVIKELGNYEELKAKNGRFSSFVEKQNIELSQIREETSQDFKDKTATKFSSLPKLMRRSSAPAIYAHSALSKRSERMVITGKKGTGLTLRSRIPRTLSEQWSFEVLATKFLDCLEQLPPESIQKAMHNFIQDCSR